MSVIDLDLAELSHARLFLGSQGRSRRRRALHGKLQARKKDLSPGEFFCGAGLIAACARELGELQTCPRRLEDRSRRGEMSERFIEILLGFRKVPLQASKPA